MKKLLTIPLVALLLTGCDQAKTDPDKPLFLTSENKLINARYAQEVCYDGVVYLYFPVSSHQAFGGAKLNKDGQVVTCTYAASKDAIEQLRRTEKATD